MSNFSQEVVNHDHVMSLLFAQQASIDWDDNNRVKLAERGQEFPQLAAAAFKSTELLCRSTV